MGIAQILASIDREIAQLRQARTLLASGAGASVGKKRGRPKKSAKAVKPPAAKPAAKSRKKRKLTAEGRKRIVEAQKRRWEARRKTASENAK